MSVTPTSSTTSQCWRFQDKYKPHDRVCRKGALGLFIFALKIEIGGKCTKTDVEFRREVGKQTGLLIDFEAIKCYNICV